MYPKARRDFAGIGHFNHVYRWRVAALLHESAFQRCFKLPAVGPRQSAGRDGRGGQRRAALCMSRKIAAVVKMPLAKHDNVVKTFPPDRTGGASRRT